MNSVLFKGARLIDFLPPAVEVADLRVADGRIVERGVDLPLGAADEEVLQLAGRTLIPGLVCGHTHVYSALARGMPGPAEPPTCFREILERVWWRLDRALDGHSIFYSGLVAGLDAVRCGTTTLIDHHASPNHILGSLGLLKIALDEVGVRGVLCYEVTERNGMKDRDLGLEETEAFLQGSQSDRFRGLVGGHAGFTLSDESLGALGDLARKYDAGVHIHVAEDPCDLPPGDADGTGLVDRLESAGALGPRTILAHCTHLGDAALARVRESGSWMTHQTRSNMNNRVGYARVERFGRQAALGTDGIGADMLAEARFAYFKNQDAGGDLSAGGAFDLLTGGHRLASRLFGMDFGALQPGAPADLVVLDYPAPTPITPDNLPWHVIFGIGSEHVQSVVVGGRFVLRDRDFEALNQPWIAEKATLMARRLWERMSEL